MILVAGRVDGYADSPPDCSQSLQGLIDNSAAGSVVHVPACIYREGVTISKPLTMVADPGAEIRGSDVWSGWTHIGRFWVHGTVPYFASSGQCQPGVSNCQWPEQVYVDGQRLTQVGGDPSTGQFAQDAQRNILLADDPSGHTVEVTTRSSWITIAANGVTVDGFTMRHSSNPAQTGAVAVLGASHVTLRNNQLAYARGAAVQAASDSDLSILNNDIHDNEQIGVVVWKSSNTLVQGNRIHNNNTKQFDWFWEAGGIKLSTDTNSTVDSNEIYSNTGYGLWCDIWCTDVSFTNNRVHHNALTGIYSEISERIHITGNAAWENGWSGGEPDQAGIGASTSDAVEISGNTLGFNANGVVVTTHDRSDAPGGHDTGISVHDNVVVSTSDANSPCGLCWTQNASNRLFAARSTNSSAANHFWWPADENGRRRFAWNGALTSLSDFNATSANAGDYLTRDAVSQALSAASMPLAPDDHAPYVAALSAN
jgi:parallel beta-helix repeat protein